MKVYGCIAKIVGEVGAIAKGRKNTAQNFNFRGIDDILNHMSPLLARHSCFMTPEILSFEQVDRPTKSGGNQTFSKVTVRYKLYADDGSFVTCDAIGEAQDTADKSAAKAQSVAYKIAMISLFCIPVEQEMLDPDEDQPEVHGDEALRLSIKKAILSAKTSEALDKLGKQYEVRKAEGRLSDSQIADLDLILTDKKKVFANG